MATTYKTRKVTAEKKSKMNTKTIVKVDDEGNRINEKVIKSFPCHHCGLEKSFNNFYTASSETKIFKAFGYVPICKDCTNKLFQEYEIIYKNQGYKEPTKKSLQKICMTFDIYYGDEVWDSVNETIVKNRQEKKDTNILPIYMQRVKMRQHTGKTYDSTIEAEDVLEAPKDTSVVVAKEITDEMRQFWGIGFAPQQYIWMQNEYNDWIKRHECNTKSQEEIFKQIVFTQWEIYQTRLKGLDTTSLNKTLLSLQESGKLTAKQNITDNVSDTEGWGIWIERFEKERPISEPDEEFKDVDKIGLLTHVFFLGHLAKSFNLKNAMSDLYDKYIAKWTVEKPEYQDEDTESIFSKQFEEVDL